MKTPTAKASVVSVAIACLGCGSGGSEDSRELSQTWDGLDLPAFYETDQTCASWTLDNDESLFVNSVSMTNAGGFHHSNWYFVPDDLYEGADGVWNCDDRGFEQLEATLSGGVAAAWSTQATSETLGFPAATAYEIPARSRIIANLHLLNASDTPVTTDFTLTLRTLPEPEVETLLRPAMFDYQSLAIPPHARSRFTMTCDVQSALGAPPDFNLYYLLPHYHELGAGTRFLGIDEQGAPSMIYEQVSSIGEVLSTTLDPPVSTAGMHDIQFSCDFMNTRDDTVGAGIGDQEMCIMVAWTDSEFIWAGFTTEPSVSVGVDDDGTQLFESQCRLVFVQ